MNVYVIFRTFKDSKSGEYYELPQAIFIELNDAEAYKKAHAEDVKENLHIEMWNAQ